MRTWCEIICMFYYMRFNDFFNNQMAKEKTMYKPVFINQNFCSIQIIKCSGSPIFYLFFGINHFYKQLVQKRKSLT
jgi:hypothetical protein